MVCLETKRLILRNYRESDIQDVLEYFSNEEVARYEDFFPMTREEVVELIESWKDKDYRMVVEKKDTRKVIGSMGYLRNEKGEFSIDYDFNPSFSKCGYATEAGRALIQHIFQVEKVDELYAECDVLNDNSWKLLERLGFVRIREKEGDCFKNDAQGNPILITSCTYMFRK